MHEKEKFNRLDRNLCKTYYKKLCYSLFDPTKLQHAKFLPGIYSGFLFKLECFVDELLSNDETPFALCLGKDDRKDYDAASLARQYFDSIPDFIDVVNMLLPQYDYSERVNAFITCCHVMGLLSEHLDWRNIHSDSKKIDPRFGDVSAAEIFNKLVKAIRSEWKTKKIQAKVNAMKKKANDRLDKYFKYVDSFFDDGCARLMVLQINLGYKKQYANSIHIHEIKKDLNHLLRNKRCNSIFHSRKGYIAKLEYRVDKGIYWHILFFLDDSEGKNSSHIHSVEDFGEYWDDTITKGRGDYWKANANVYHNDAGRGGIWVINLSDTKLRNNLKESVIGYLCKVDQFIKPKFGPGVELFRSGYLPKKRVKKRGRPRKQLES